MAIVIAFSESTSSLSIEQISESLLTNRPTRVASHGRAVGSDKALPERVQRGVAGTSPSCEGPTGTVAFSQAGSPIAVPRQLRALVTDIQSTQTLNAL